MNNTGIKSVSVSLYVYATHSMDEEKKIPSAYLCVHIVCTFFAASCERLHIKKMATIFEIIISTKDHQCCCVCSIILHMDVFAVFIYRLSCNTHLDMEKRS